MHNWDKIMKSSSNQMKNIYLRGIEQYIQRVLKYIELEHMNNMELNPNELEVYIWNKKIEEENKNTMVANELSLRDVKIKSIENLLRNPEVLNRIYEKYKNKKITKPSIESFSSIKGIKESAVKEAILYIRRFLEKNELKTGYTEMDALNILLSNSLDVELQKVKELEIDLLQNFNSKIIERYDLANKYIENNNREFRQIGLKDVVEGDNIKGLFKNFWTKESLNKLSEEELSALNIFWENRKAKEVSSINLAYSIIRELNLYDKIVYEKEIKISDDEVKKAIRKVFFLQELAKIQWNKSRDKEDKLISEETKAFIEKHKHTYEKIFGGKKMDTNFLDDFTCEYQNIIQEKNAYVLKSNIATTKIIRLLNNKTIKNWGIIEEADKQDDNKILIGIDINGFSMPIRIHLEQNKLQRELYAMEHNTILPIYKGNNDFSKNLWIMKSHLIVPINKEYKDKLRKSVKSMELMEYSNTLAHLMYLADGKAPKHFYERVPGTNSIAQVKHLMDINNGDRYVQKKGKIISEQEYMEMFNDINNMER